MMKIVLPRVTLYYVVMSDNSLQDSDALGSRVGEGVFFPPVKCVIQEHSPSLSAHVGGGVDLPDNRRIYEEALREAQ